MSLNNPASRHQALTHSIQDYLKIIYELTESGAPASTTALARRLGVAPASVTGMVQKLAAAKPALLIYRKHQGVTLTQRGSRAALEVIRHHRLIETWLARTLGYTWEEVHGEAERLEHDISEDFEKRMSAALGNPRRDPHGEPIPSAELVMPLDASIPLSELRPFQEAIVCRVQAPDRDMLERLDRLGLVLGARVRVAAYSRGGQVVRLEIGGHKSEVALGQAVTRRVFVEGIKEVGK